MARTVDRGNNTTCPAPEGDEGLHHAQYREVFDDRTASVKEAGY